MLPALVPALALLRKFVPVAGEGALAVPAAPPPAPPAPCANDGVTGPTQSAAARAVQPMNLRIVASFHHLRKERRACRRVPWLTETRQAGASAWGALLQLVMVGSGGSPP